MGVTDLNAYKYLIWVALRITMTRFAVGLDVTARILALTVKGRFGSSCYSTARLFGTSVVTGTRDIYDSSRTSSKE